MGMLHWLFTALMANHRHSSRQPGSVLSFHSSNKRSDSAWHINNSSLKGKFSNFKCVCGGQIQCIGKRAGEKAIKRWQTALWKSSMNVVMNCVSRSVHTYSHIRICSSLAAERFKTLSISIMAHSSTWHLQPARHWQMFFCIVRSRVSSYSSMAQNIYLWHHVGCLSSQLAPP